MQKTYKLKQWYPGLPVRFEVGTLVYETNNSGWEQFYFSGKDFVPACDVETNPDFWELVQKTSWTIEEINEAIEKWKFTSKNEELLLVSDLKSEFGL